MELPARGSDNSGNIYVKVYSTFFFEKMRLEARERKGAKIDMEFEVKTKTRAQDDPGGHARRSSELLSSAEAVDLNSAISEVAPWCTHFEIKSTDFYSFRGKMRF